MTTNDVQLHLTITEPDADVERVDALTRRLMHDLRALGAESIERPTSEPTQEGAKGSAAFTLGALALVVIPAVLPSLVEFLQAWALRSENRKVKIKVPSGIEVEFTSKKRLSQEALLALVERLAQSLSEAR